MNRKTLIIILVVVGVICLCAAIAGIVLVTQAGRLIGQTVSTDAEKTSQVAQTITDYKLPPNYKESFSMSLMGIAMAAFTTDKSDTFIMLFQFPPNTNMSQQQMEEQLRQMGSQQTGETYTLEKVGTLPTKIRGNPEELGVYEGSNQSGTKVRQLIGVFKGKGGTAFLMVTGSIESWDQPSINAFIASMR